MKTRESGMPEEQMWASFFSPAQTLAKLGLTGLCRDVADFGCGYGTFAIPAAKVVSPDYSRTAGRLRVLGA
ncbi:MAG: hypothetical protein ACP5O1_11005 [Phycisphaerae bacterium]